MSREEDGDIAELVFGWVWLESEYDRCKFRKGLFPPENDPVFERSNWGPTVYATAHRDTERFSDWDRCGFRRGIAGHIAGFLPHYTTDASDDYSVLEKVRDAWDVKDIRSLSAKIRYLWHERYDRYLWHERKNTPYPMETFYQPGDYSRAALAVLKAKLEKI